MADIFKRTTAENAFGVFSAYGAEAPVEVAAELGHVACKDGRDAIFRTRIAFDKSTQPVAGVAGKIGFPHLAVVNDIESALDLFPDDFGNRATHAVGKCGFIAGLPRRS